MIMIILQWNSWKKKITFVHYGNRQKLSVPIFIKKKKRTETNIPIFLDVK